MNMLQTSGFITKSREVWWNFAERNVSFETSSPFSFCSPAFFCMSTRTPNFFFFPRLQNFWDFRRSSGSIVSLWTKGSSPWESWRNWRFFGAYNWLKNGPRMKMSTLSYWKRGCSSCLPYPSLLLTKRVSQSPMISEILKDLESDVTEVPWVFPRTAGCRGGNHLVTTRMPWKQFLRWQGIPTRKNRLTCHEFFFFFSHPGGV